MFDVSDLELLKSAKKNSIIKQRRFGDAFSLTRGKNRCSVKQESADCRYEKKRIK